VDGALAGNGARYVTRGGLRPLQHRCL